jgi:hypothetical protein
LLLQRSRHHRPLTFSDIRTQDFIDGVDEPRIGITFMAEADHPTVTVPGQIGESQQRPGQNDPSWLVNTAGTLLKRFHVDRDSSVTQCKSTSTVASNEQGLRVAADTDACGTDDKLHGVKQLVLAPSAFRKKQRFLSSRNTYTSRVKRSIVPATIAMDAKRAAVSVKYVVT